ncbi:coiled-coil domain-containing protein 97 [Anopheles nili]|uniref:coiled-coil domain-containing protein 97 n=1 Tax=Anopheles nili TaxID=185578 RepID=UPI00237B8011|nr:coiled-coil domain-containing protein 97 [Anopheles nili]
MRDADDTTESLSLVNESEMFDHITHNPKVFFKNQQINDPELTDNEKGTILRNVLNKSHCTFLSRFGVFMKDEHLRFFEQAEQTLGYSPDERYEIDYHLDRIRRLRNGGRAVEVRNRRYAALLKMCTDGTYFSETEMMQREPLLYEQLVGQFMTEQEKRERDASVAVPRSVVSILFNQIDKEQAKETLHKLESEECRQEQGTDDSEEAANLTRPNSPGVSRAQWGNFDDEEETRLAARRQECQKRARQRRLAIPPIHLVTAGERDLMRDEFIGIMYARFIAGEEEEFDYSQVDDSMEYDDLDIVEQDEQEKYFDRDEEPETDDQTVVGDGGEESEDDLDVYMRHLNQHLEQQERTAERNEIVRDPICEYDSDE